MRLPKIQSLRFPASPLARSPFLFLLYEQAFLIGLSRLHPFPVHTFSRPLHISGHFFHMFSLVPAVPRYDIHTHRPRP